ncbi:secretin N-terminal domain-containing protein [Pseudovibrio ascidiaceicola]|uniref:secretin N-terminal domain-containing protein n=1 Tax=Pseudovibrio ascidiaceicola TaxID=285279 RepID=UPI003D36601C
MRIPSFLTLSFLAMVLTGCSVTGEAQQNAHQANVQATALLSDSIQPLPPRDTSPVQLLDGVWLGGKAIRNEHGSPLPGRFEQPNGVSINSTQPQDIREIAAEITQITGIQVVVSLPPAKDGASAAVPSQDLTTPTATDGEQFNSTLATISSSAADEPTPPALSTMKLRYSGKLSGLLDVVSTKFNLAWRYDRKKISLTSIVTQTFDVPALPIIANLSFDLRSKSATNTTGGGTDSGQTATTTTAVDLWKEFDEGLKSIIGEETDGTYSLSNTAGTVTVTADPETVSRVSEYVRKMNARLSDQVAISVQVYSLRFKDTNAYNLDVGAILSQAGKYAVNIGNQGVVAATDTAGPGLGWALVESNGLFGGSNYLVQALATKGDVSVVTTASVTTLNGVPVPLQVGEQRDYVKSVKTTEGENGTETELQPGSVTSGFNLHLVPRVDRTGDLLLQYGINISELTGTDDGFDTFESGDTRIQLRRLSQRNFVQQSRIPNGKTLVLSGFEQVRSASKQSGVGKPAFSLLGGGESSSVEREIVVIAITPTLLSSYRR